jgi:hypothetical protein
VSDIAGGYRLSRIAARFHAAFVAVAKIAGVVLMSVGVVNPPM